MRWLNERDICLNKEENLRYIDTRIQPLNHSASIELEASDSNEEKKTAMSEIWSSFK